MESDWHSVQVLTDIFLESVNAITIWLRRLKDSENKSKLTGEEVHSPDFRSVQWYGEQYTFTTTQAACMKFLWWNWQQGTPVISELTILDAAGSAGDRLRDVFDKGKHPAWGTMIIPAGKGAFQLADNKKS